MGVKGIKALMRSIGWCPSWEDENETGESMATENGAADASATTPRARSARQQSACGCSAQLWKEWNASDAFLGGGGNNQNGPPLQRISPGSKFLIDGNGLAFYLHSIAYSRYLRSLLSGTTGSASLTSSSSSCCPRIQTIAASESTVVQALPCMMPLSWLRGITHEFVTTLKQHDMQLEVFWDGPLRRFKTRTDDERLQFRQQQESQLELFCRHGILPASKHIKYACQWKDEFPYSRLFLVCVRHALQEQNVHSVQCNEEADVELAMKACGDPNAYIVGFDSDFFFFRNVQYIPLNEISIQSAGLYAFCATRLELAQMLGLDDDHRMVDLALLMGNDYVDPLMHLKLPIDLQQNGKKRNAQDIIFHIQCNYESEVEAKDDSASQEAVNFVRALYNLHSLDDAFAPQIDQSVEENEDVEKQNGARMCIPTLLPQDATVRDGVIRCLKNRLDEALENESPKARTTWEMVLETYAEMIISNGSQFPTNTKYKRPTWDEMKAGFYIENCVRQLYHSSPASILTKVTPPDATINRLQFHTILSSARQMENVTGETRMLQGNEDEPVELPTPEPLILPIDEHESTIIENIRNNRVTIIHGETGCGKSSRVPVMLLKSPSPDGSLRKVKFFISQPRRIAAKALVERVRQCEPEFRNKFALRMGHGWKEYESSSTQVYFVTTGYLVRLLANHPERFDDCTHLVIDEVHERSVDTDILCLLCRRLLETNKHIRLVLMSATLATKMYKEYFNVPNEPIHVGVRRFPITEYYLENLQQFGLPGQEMTDIIAIEKEIETKKCNSAPTSAELSKRLKLTARLATIVGQPGASVLIFVPGMGEIISISEHIESYHVAGINYTCFPIHGDIPFEEQMGAFDEPAEDEVKIIIATNAAESSVTLPNVDHVICLGLCRQIIYNQASHRQMLTPAWISQASAKQRAGRTGRVRPGSVYRLYSKHAYTKYMEEFEPGEMVRIPLDSVILMLKQILHQEVKPVFLDCLEPPPLDTVDRSFQSLYRWNFITGPDDKADITSLGAFVSSLGIDLSLGSYVGLGIQFGVAAEAIEMAAMMSLPKSPFQMSSPMWMEPGVFNETASKTYSAKSSMDDGVYSEPMALMNALWDYSSSPHKTSWCFKNRIAVKRWQQVASSRNSLRKRVASFLGINENRLLLQLPPKHMPREKVLILRLLKVWVFSNSIVECAKSPLKLEADGSVCLSVKSKSKVKLENEMLSQVLDPDRHPFTLREFHEFDETGVFEEEESFSLNYFMQSFEERLLSYASEKEIEIVLCHSNDEYYLYVDKSGTCAEGIYKALEVAKPVIQTAERYVFKYVDLKRRGFRERSAGLWSIQDTATSRGEVYNQKQFQKIRLSKRDCPNFDYVNSCTIHELFVSGIKSVMKWEFKGQGKGKKTKKSKISQPFQVSLRGSVGQISKQDMRDLLGKESNTISADRHNVAQSILLRQSDSAAHDRKEVHSRNEPLFVDVPESARILALLASSQRKGCVLRFPINTDKDVQKTTVDFSMKEDEINVVRRWRRLGNDNLVYVDDSIPATAINTTAPLYAVAANALELQRGGMRVEGLTLLPPNPLFLLLSFLSFGLEMGSVGTWITSDDSDTKKNKISKRVSKAYTWLAQRVGHSNAKAESDTIVVGTMINSNFQEVPMVCEKSEIRKRLQQAANFHEDSMEMGEALVCFPEKIAELCALFEVIDGSTLAPWDTLMDESLTAENLNRWRKEPKVDSSEIVRTCSKVDKAEVKTSLREKPLKEKPKGSDAVGKQHEAGANATKAAASEKQKLEQHSIRHFKKEVLVKAKDWFSTKLGVGESPPSFPSTNILALLFQLYRELVLDDPLDRDTKRFDISLIAHQWDIVRFRNDKTGNFWYSAYFVHDEIALLPVIGRGKNKLPKWIKKQKGRPTEVEDAQHCVPPHVKSPSMYKIPGGDGRLVFGSLEEALQMEAAFWLQQQFCHAQKTSLRHWYMHPIDQMIEILRKHKL